MTDEVGVTPAEPKANEKNFRIDFIDPLFAVAIHVGLVEGLMKEHWLEARQYPESLSDYANLLMFLAGIWTIAASWVGYHRSVQARRIQGDARFILDIALLALYIFLLIYFRTPIAIAILMASVYVVYIAWDYFKTVEYPRDFYQPDPTSGSSLVPNGLTYLWRCLIEWVSPTAGSKLRSGAVTVGWALVF